MGKKGTLFWLVEFEGEPLPKKMKKHWAPVFVVGGV